MSPLGSLVEAWLHPVVVAGSLFVGWWAVWFTLGRGFRRTLSMVLVSRAVSILGAACLSVSGALGSGDPIDGPGAMGWLAACAAVGFVSWSLEAAVLGILMRRRRSSWKWDSYDLAVLAAAHLLYVLGAGVVAA